MAKPTTRDEFKENCLRRLGKPVIKINVDDTQVEDRIDEALEYFYDYHFNGTERVYYKHQLTQTDKDNGYIDIPNDMRFIVGIFQINTLLSSSNLFDIRYQYALNDLYTFTASSMIPYYSARMQMELINELLVGQPMIRFNRHINKLHIDMDMEKVETGSYIIVDAYKEVDPDNNSDVWGDWWLLRYATELIKKQWGSNLSKYSGIALIGGLEYNGEQIYSQAVEELQKLEEQMLDAFSLPPTDMMA